MAFVEYTEPQKVKARGRNKKFTITCVRTGSAYRRIYLSPSLKAKLGDRCRILVNADQKAFMLKATRTGGYPVRKSSLPIIRQVLESVGIDVFVNWSTVGIADDEGGVTFHYGNLPKVAGK